MIRGLKIVLIVWAAQGILLGLGMLFVPERLGPMLAYEMGPVYVPYLLAMLAIVVIVPSVFIIVAMTRDLLKHIMWVQMAITWAILLVAVYVYSALMGFVSFKQVMPGTIIDGAFFIAFLALYPWRAAQK